MRIKLLVIILLASVLRLYHLSVVPPALSWDEVSIGYNAYSILTTGKDEHEKLMPMDTFAAYGDYKPPLSIYLTVPSVAVFGLNEFAVRLPAALFGILTVFITYLLILKIIPSVALLSAGLLAISPWHINLSRAGFEATIALFFIVLGAYWVLKAHQQKKYWIVAWLPFVAAIYTFNSARYFSVIFCIGLFFYSLAKIRKNVRFVAIGILLSVITMLPILPHLVSKEARLRFAEVNIFTDASVVQTANSRIERQHNSILAKVVNNRRVGFAKSYLVHFFDNLEPWFLFMKGDGNPKFSIRDVGQLYLIEAPFLVLGILLLFLREPRVAGLLVFWIVAAIIPAAVARETPHALRILNSLPTWQIFVAYGILSSILYVQKIQSKKLLIAYYLLLISFYLFSLLYYLHNYYVHYPKEFSAEWQYGYKQAIEKISQISQKYDRVVITESIGRPYMYTLFYTKTPPGEFLRSKDSAFDAAGFYHVYGFTKYRFGGTLPDTLDNKTIYVWDAGIVPKGARVIDTINYLNGIPVLIIFDSGNVAL